jgi:hypothetical protein
VTLRCCHRAIIAGLLVLCHWHIASADRTVAGDAGVEFDSNVALLADASASKPRTAASVLRAAVVATFRESIQQHRFAANVGGRLRAIANAEVPEENVGLGSASVQWLFQPSDHGAHQQTLGSRSVRQFSVGARASAIDAHGLTSNVGARTFRNATAEALLTLQQRGHLALLSFGARDFLYRPSAAQSYQAAVATLSLDSPLWKSLDGDSAWRMTASVGLDARSFSSNARTSLCPLDMLASSCIVDAGVQRHDLVTRASAELTYAGDVIVAIGYRYLASTSNSFGQSLSRHQFTAALTKPLSAKLYASVVGVAQLDVFARGALLADATNTETTTLADEARSMVQLRVGYQLAEHWTAEARGAAWTNLVSDTSYRRQTIGFSLVYD